ncbi:MAG TPA: hypothetical protein VMC42_09145 [Methanoregulaceae archaeon]|nr:hypothetical protein [Methanoregulaceae archaeon]
MRLFLAEKHVEQVKNNSAWSYSGGTRTSIPVAREIPGTSGV